MGGAMTGKRKGYTLVELLAVSVLSLTLLTLAVAGFRTWLAPATSERAISDFEAELARLRSYSLSRGCQTRLRAIDDAGGDLIVTERMEVGDEDADFSRSWRSIAPTGRLDRVAVSPRELYFRPDGSCATNETALFNDAEFTSYTFRLERLQGVSGNRDTGIRQITISARSGLSSVEDTK